MSVEANIFSALSSVVSARVYPDAAPYGAVMPYVVYQQVGGETIWFVEQTKPSKKNGRFQIRVWAETRLQASTLARQVEDTMVASTTLRAVPASGVLSDYDPTMKWYGTIQDFYIWFDD